MDEVTRVEVDKFGDTFQLKVHLGNREEPVNGVNFAKRRNTVRDCLASACSFLEANFLGTGPSVEHSPSAGIAYRASIFRFDDGAYAISTYESAKGRFTERYVPGGLIEAQVELADMLRNYSPRHKS